MTELFRTGRRMRTCSHRHAGLDALTDRKAETARRGQFDQEIACPPADAQSNEMPDGGLDIPEFLRRAPKQPGQPCAQCADANGTHPYCGPAYPAGGLHRECARYRQSRGLDKASYVKPANGKGAADHRCDYCGQPGASGQWDWPGRPDGIWLHERCEAPWFDSKGGAHSEHPAVK
jgi:hypothetical protein